MQNEAKNIYHQRPPHKDSHQFYLHVPVLVQVEISGVLLRTMEGQHYQKFVDTLVDNIDKQRSELTRIAETMGTGEYPYPTNRDTVMEFSK
jgi:hypothetical protein